MGEKLENIEEFDPARMAGRILGMGDVVALVELAQEHMDQAKSEAAMEKAFSGTFTLDDFLDQMTMVEKMGGLTSLLSKLPGAGNIEEEMKKAGFNEKMLAHKKAIVLSMTPVERAEPEVMDGNRRRRIAKGSGRPVQEVNQMLKEFRDARDMMQKLGNAQGGALGRMFGGRREKRKQEQFRNLRKRGWSLRPGKPGEHGRQGGS